MRLGDKSSIRILHVVGGMNRGGIETWLMHILRHIDRDRFHMDFLVHTTQPCAYDQEIRALGSKIIPCLHPSRPWLYGRNFQRILREYGPYNIVHSHVHYYSGYILRLAKQAGVPVRIAHSHLDSSTQVGWNRQFYTALMKAWISRYATTGLAASRLAAADLFSSVWETDPRWRTLYYGVDLKPFHTLVDISVRAEFGIPVNALVIGHVGRFEQQKNHQFLLEIAAEIVKREPKMRLLLVGEGSLRSEIEQKVSQLNLTDHVIFTGSRPDIARLMLGAMDIFLFPSLYEGLGLVLIEAQAAALPCVFSDVVPKEADIVKPLVTRISLLQPASYWADAVIAASKQNTAIINQQEALTTVENSQFALEKRVNELQSHYLEQVDKSL